MRHPEVYEETFRKQYTEISSEYQYISELVTFLNLECRKCSHGNLVRVKIISERKDSRRRTRKKYFQKEEEEGNIHQHFPSKAWLSYCLPLSTR
jgi:uncharacterized protein YprB with RNaseH-like and TPR domain